ncbi:MAG: O-antigen ligase family protein, partial [Candidatus Binatia bacterium]
AAVYGIVQHFTGADWYRGVLGRPRMVKPRIADAAGFASIGFFRNYVTYAHVLVLPLGLALARAACTGGALATLGALALALAVLFSTARGAWVSAIAMGVALVAMRRRGGIVLLVAGVVVVGVWLASPGLRAQVIPALTTTENNAGRIGIYRANLDIVRDNPLFGLGFGRYQREAAPYYDRHPEADRRSHAHNAFLQLGAEAGLVGLAAFMLLFATAIRYGAETMAWLDAAADPTYATALGAWLGIIGFLASGLTHYTFGDSEVATAMWVTLAVLMRLRDT